MFLDVAPPHVVKVLMLEGGKGSPLALKHKVYLDFVGVDNPPYDYVSRLHPMYEGSFSTSAPDGHGSIRRCAYEIEARQR